MKRSNMLTAMVLLVLPVTFGSAYAAEVKILSAFALRPVLSALTAEFEQSSGHKLVIAYDLAGAVRDRIQRGEVADVAIITPPQIEELVKQGKIIGDSRVDVAKVGIGVAVRAGAPKPDFGSVEAFKRSMLAAKSILYGDPARGAAAGIAFEQVLDRLGIAADMKSKTKVHQAVSSTMELLAKGEAEFGVSQISLIVGAPGVELAGALPAELQVYTVFSAGIVTDTKETVSAKALIKFLSGPAAASVIKTKGMEPG